MSREIKPFKKLFVVIDPTRMIQRALIKGEWIAATDNASMVLYCCIYDERFNNEEAEQEAELKLTREWLERLAEPARNKGIDVEFQVEWHADWRSAVSEAAKSAESSLVIKSASRHSALGRRLTRTSDLLLVRECACPVLLVYGHRLWEKKKLLAAVKLKPEDTTHERLNEQLIDLSHSIATRAGLDLYAVTAYQGEDIYFDRQKFATMCRLDRDHVFSADGAPERVIATTAHDIGADMIVIGNPGDGKRNTAVLLVDQVETDILFLPQSAD